MLKVETSEICPHDFVSAAWTEFFVSRNRGVSIETNLGWLRNMTGFYTGLRRHGRLIAGLVLRHLQDPMSLRQAGAIGLVWVAPQERGQGYSSMLLEPTIAEARRRGMNDLLLWTGKPAVYEKVGFKGADNALLGPVTAQHLAPELGKELSREVWPGRGSARGLPAFASSGARWISAGATATTLETAAGAVLAEWTGSDADVARLLDACMPPVWSLNALTGDTLPATLVASRWRVDLAPIQLRMVLPLGPERPEVDAYRLRLLDRI
ncbi:GNAT family N-acetyltransferase [Devosia sp. MC1541]|uniref:GNAT family N-acetyltransferase n=1 Tax=Devosia sp. MC1541 TaxID=2725264 RepID=UPI00145C3C88|nr:GNAT family N-acetyltransferase [Devosia sp. MC1541]